jgi:hypothetical protein
MSARRALTIKLTPAEEVELFGARPVGWSRRRYLLLMQRLSALVVAEYLAGAVPPPAARPLDHGSPGRRVAVKGGR